MKFSALIFFSISLSLLFLLSCTSEPPQSSLLQGVWKVTKEIDLTDNTLTDPGNAHFVFTSSHTMNGGGKEERPIVTKNFAHMSAEEIKSQLPTGAGFMSYKIVDGNIHRTVLWALSEFFEGRTIVTEFEVTKDTLVLRDDHHADGHLREWHMVRIE
jgi:hypothetical protein